MKKHKYLAAIALSAFLTAVSVLPSLSAGAATASISDWKAYNASAATNTVIEETDSGIQVTGTVGVANNENSLVVLQGAPPEYEHHRLLRFFDGLRYRRGARRPLVCHLVQ